MVNVEDHEPGCPAIADDKSDYEYLIDAGVCFCNKEKSVNVKVIKYFCPKCGFPLIEKEYKGIPIFACENIGCMAAFTEEEIKAGKEFCFYPFKSGMCAYIGTAEQCDKTFQRCKALGNEIHFPMQIKRRLI